MFLGYDWLVATSHLLSGLGHKALIQLTDHLKVIITYNIFNISSNWHQTIPVHLGFKDNNILYDTKWSILAKAKTFNPVAKKCRDIFMEDHIL